MDLSELFVLEAESCRWCSEEIEGRLSALERRFHAGGGESGSPDSLLCRVLTGDGRPGGQTWREDVRRGANACSYGFSATSVGEGDWFCGDEKEGRGKSQISFLGNVCVTDKTRSALRTNRRNKLSVK